MWYTAGVAYIVDDVGGIWHSIERWDVYSDVTIGRWLVLACCCWLVCLGRNTTVTATVTVSA